MKTIMYILFYAMIFLSVLAFAAMFTEGMAWALIPFVLIWLVWAVITLKEIQK